MATHGMIDLETLGVNPDSVLMTIGAVKFNPFSQAEPHAPLYLRCDIEEQSTTLGRTIDDNTLAWWSKQPQEIQDEAFGEEHERVSMDSLTKQLNKWCVGLDYIWCQGPTFDFVILQDLYKNIGKPTPWNYWQIRDSRTLFKMLPYDPRKKIQQAAHNALADCYYQAKCVQSTYKHFGVEREN
tara:strand:- start:3545 stop:4093 length:549 start_codon:yes stop_codon:yes gene_type:complete